MLKLLLLYIEAFPSLSWSLCFQHVEAFSSLYWSLLFFILTPLLHYIGPCILHIESMSVLIVKPFLSLSCSPFPLHRDAKALIFSGPCSPSQSRVKCVGACFLWLYNWPRNRDTHTQITQRDAQTSAKNATSERMCVHKINFESKRAVTGKYRASIKLAQDNES